MIWIMCGRCVRALVAIPSATVLKSRASPTVQLSFSRSVYVLLAALCRRCDSTACLSSACFNSNYTYTLEVVHMNNKPNLPFQSLHSLPNTSFQILWPFPIIHPSVSYMSLVIQYRNYLFCCRLRLWFWCWC